MFYLGLYGSNGDYSCSGNGSNSVTWNDNVCEATPSALLNDVIAVPRNYFTTDVVFVVFTTLFFHLI
jgi:hypothetical protein